MKTTKTKPTTINEEQMNKLFDTLCEFHKKELGSVDYKDYYRGTRIAYDINDEYTVSCMFFECPVWNEQKKAYDFEWELSTDVKLAENYSFKSLCDDKFKTRDFSSSGIEVIKTHIEKLINACKKMPVMFDVLKTQFNTILAK